MDIEMPIKNGYKASEEVNIIFIIDYRYFRSRIPKRLMCHSYVFCL
jgi:hypothetical protein